MSDRYEVFRKSKILNVPSLVLPGLTVGDIALSLSTLVDSRNKVTLIENRGLHQTDKRTGLPFYGGFPDVSVADIYGNAAFDKQIRLAVQGRGEDTTPLTVAEYKKNLMIRSLILQIINPIHRHDWVIKVTGERIRKVLNDPHSFIRMALEPSNVEFVSRFLLGK